MKRKIISSSIILSALLFLVPYAYSSDSSYVSSFDVALSSGFGFYDIRSYTKSGTTADTSYVDIPISLALSKNLSSSFSLGLDMMLVLGAGHRRDSANYLKRNIDIVNIKFILFVDYHFLDKLFFFRLGAGLDMGLPILPPNETEEPFTQATYSAVITTGLGYNIFITENFYIPIIFRVDISFLKKFVLLKPMFTLGFAYSFVL